MLFYLSERKIKENGKECRRKVICFGDVCLHQETNQMFLVLPVRLLSVAVSQRGLGLFLGEIKVLDYCGTVNKPQFVPFLWSLF